MEWGIPFSLAQDKGIYITNSLDIYVFWRSKIAMVGRRRSVRENMILSMYNKKGIRKRFMLELENLK
jgi:hypothetical protein